MSRTGQKNVTSRGAVRKQDPYRYEDGLWNFARWLTAEDEFSDVIISSRIRLARNIKGYPFPNRASKHDLQKVVKKAEDACSKSTILLNCNYIDGQHLTEWDGRYFVERRLASPQFLESDIPKLLVIGPQENLSAMVNEEDHLRLQSLEPGLGIKKAWQKIRRLDDELEEGVNFSFTNRYGYLTSCPTNLGTGLRVSTFVHLPALSMTGQIDTLLKKLPNSEIAVRGFYGEGSDAIGDIYQISNQLTLGRSEKIVIERMIKTAKQLVDIERKARLELVHDNHKKVDDSVHRALGILSHARIITSFEAMDLLSTVRLGIEAKFITGLNRLAINQLLVLVQPAHLQRIYGKILKAEDRDVLRADFLRQNLDS
jgi:protein arginine kinase